MNRVLVKFAIISTVLLISCAPQQTVSNSANQSQVTATPSAILVQNSPANRQQSDQRLSAPKNEYVPDEQTAISIAVAVWIPIYGKEQIESEKPYTATLKNGIWTVTGSLPQGYDGGTAVAEISQESGCILRVIHYQ